MPVRNSNLLLSDAAPSPEGLAYDSVVAWYGGRLNVVAEGEFAGSIDLMASVRLPQLAVNQTYADVMDEGDFVTLHTFAGPEIYSADINPCMLAVRVNVAGGTVRIIVN